MRLLIKNKKERKACRISGPYCCFLSDYKFFALSTSEDHSKDTMAKLMNSLLVCMLLTEVMFEHTAHEKKILLHCLKAKFHYEHKSCLHAC